MRFLYFLADHVFRFKYRDPYAPPAADQALATWDVIIYEEEQNKMLRDFFIMGCVTAFALVLILAVTGASAWLIAH